MPQEPSPNKLGFKARIYAYGGTFGDPLESKIFKEEPAPTCLYMITQLQRIQDKIVSSQDDAATQSRLECHCVTCHVKN